MTLRRRAAREILARARIICFACNLADGIEIEPRWLDDLGLVPHLTPQVLDPAAQRGRAMNDKSRDAAE